MLSLASPSRSRASVRTRVIAVALPLIAVVMACHTDAPASDVNGGCAQECVTSVPCRRGSCAGELFWNGCCPCPQGSVVAWGCGEGGAP